MQESQPDPLQHYLSRFTPIQPLLVGDVVTEDQAITWLVHEGYKAGREMIRTHLKADIIRFIVIAQTLELHGYTMIWIKHKNCVGATRKEEVNHAQPVREAGSNQLARTN